MVPKLCGNSNVSYTVILLEIPQNRHWCKACTQWGLLADSLETQEATAEWNWWQIYLKDQLSRLKWQIPGWQCVTAHITWEPDRSTAQRLAEGLMNWRLHCLLQSMALPYSRQHVEVIHSNLLCVCLSLLFLLFLLHWQNFLLQVVPGLLTLSVPPCIFLSHLLSSKSFTSSDLFQICGQAVCLPSLILPKSL